MRHLLPTLLLLAPLAVLAQQEERLPDLTPQEFEIRGDLQVSLPDLERQPLRGFAPPPRTYVVPADREPFVGPYAQRLEDLPGAPLAPAPDPSLLHMTPRFGQIDLMAGRYLGRRARFTTGAGGFSLDARYSGYSDFEPLAGREELVPQPAPARYTAGTDNFAGHIGYSTGDAVRFSVDADAAHHEYGLNLAMLEAQDDRLVQRFGVQTLIEHTGQDISSAVRARVERSRVNDRVDGDGGTVNGIEGQNETRIVADGHVGFGRFRFEGSVAYGSLDLSTTGDPQPEWTSASVVSFEAGATLRVPLSAGQAQIGVMVAGFSPSEFNRARISPPRDEWGGFYIGPVLGVQLELAPGAQVYAHTRTGVTHRGQFDIFRDNPYASTTPAVAPDVHQVDAEGGLHLQAASIQLRVFLGGRLSPNQAYFVKPSFSTPLEMPHTFFVHYERASLLRTGADVTFYAPADISISLGVEVRRSRLSDHDEPVPFVAPLSGRASISVPFARARGLVQASLHAEGRRPSGRFTTPADGVMVPIDAPAWADLTLEAHYRFAGRFGLVGRVDQLGVRAERWPGFPQPSTMVMAGVRAGW